MEEISFRKTVKILSEDEFLIEEIRNLVESLEISWTDVRPLKERYELGHFGAGALMEFLLSQWISKQGAKATLAELTRMLRQMGRKACAEKLQELQKRHPSKRKHSEEDWILFGIKEPLDFIGRDAELQKLNEYFHSGERFVVISGLGGIGKTNLAMKFAFTATLPDTEKSIAKSWLSGETPQSLQNSIVNLCLHFNLNLADSQGNLLGLDKMLKEIHTELKTSGFSKWLVIIDNVDETHKEFEIAVKTLRGFNHDVFLLVTSRLRDIYAGTPDYLDVTELTSKDSMELMMKSLKITDTDNSAIKLLCEQLGNFPLALNQAVAYIKQQQRRRLKGMAYGVQNYLDELSKSETLGLDKDLRLAEYPKATLKVWNITLDRIKECHGADGAMALDLLDVMAFINPYEINVKFLYKLFPLFHKIKQEENQIEDCLEILLLYSLISSSDSGINIHRLVQLAVRTRMSNDRNRRDLEILKTFWASFCSKEWGQNDLMHILKIWSHSCTHHELDITRAKALKTVFYELRNLRMVKEALDFASKGCDFLLNLNDPENPEYFLMVLRLSFAQMERGLPQKAMGKLTLVYEIFQGPENNKFIAPPPLEKYLFLYSKLTELCGDDDDDTLEIKGLIANALMNIKKYEESIKWSEGVLQSKKRIYGNRHGSTIRAKGKLAYTLKASGKGEGAFEMYKEILEWTEGHLGKGHRETLLRAKDMATCLMDLGKYEEASEHLRRVVCLQEEHFGVDHPITLTTKEWLAEALENMGEIEEALRILEEVIVQRVKESGKDHPDTYSVGDKITFLKQMSEFKGDGKYFTQ